MTTTLFGLYGAGGFAREVMNLVASLSKATTERPFNDYVFVDRSAGPAINGVRVVSEDDFYTYTGGKCFNLAISNAELRRGLAQKASGSGAAPLSLIDPTAIVNDNNVLGEGAIICSYCTITTNAKIGRFFHMNMYSYVAHDCEIGDFVTFAPKVCCNGRVIVEDGAYIGTGAILRQGQADQPLRIGAGAVVGMGAVVTKDVAPGVTVVGNPAKPLL